MTAETRTAEAILQALIMMRSSMRLSLTSPDPLCTMNTSSPRTDSPISTLCTYTIRAMILHLSPVTIIFPSDHYPPSSIPLPSKFARSQTHKRVLLRETSRRLSSQSLPCLCVGEFGELHFTELQAQTGSDAPRKFRVGVAGEHFYVRHGRKGSRGTTSLRSKVTNEGLSDWKPEEFKGH